MDDDDEMDEDDEDDEDEEDDVDDELVMEGLRMMRMMWR